jgi:hypothetical protein
MHTASNITLFSAFCLFIGPYVCLGQTPQVLFITSGDSPGAEWRTIRILCDFYGLTCGWRTPDRAIVEFSPPAGDRQAALAAIVDASVLDSAASLPDATATWKSLRDARIPVLLLASRPTTPSIPDSNGSDTVARLQFVRLDKKLSSWQTTQADPQVMRELTAVSAQVLHNTTSSQIALGSTGPGDRIAPLMLVRSSDGVSYPVYGEFRDATGVVFCAAFGHPVPDNGYVFEPDKGASLISIIPILTFLRFAGGPYCWHRDCDYANLTIDDPWLREPYGCLSFQGLLAQMQKARFHTTIAFIPWNYDRSTEKVVAIFRDHPEYYSICVHGNNHDHWEFYEYRTTRADPLPAKPFAVQEANIRQGLARMERFRQLTGLSFDPVMAFPHYIAPLGTFSLLKKYNFLMTSNATNIPLNLDPPPDPVLYVRSITTDFGNFASATRYSPGRSRAAIAFDLFLDSPVLFFDHHGLFHRGIDAFNKTAEMVNALQPNTKWTSLGDIARHSYLQRSRPDGHCDIKAFCRSIDLVNDGQRAMTYFVEKEETGDVPIRHVFVDGVPYPYAVSDGRLRLTADVQPGQSRRIDIEYEDHFQAAQVDISRNDPHINRIRALSDFRDCTLLRHALTRSVVDFYYTTNLYRLGPKGAAAVCCVIMAAMATGGWRLFRLVRRRAEKEPTSGKIGAIHGKPGLGQAPHRT